MCVRRHSDFRATLVLPLSKTVDRTTLILSLQVMQGVDRLSIAALRKLGVSRNKFRVGEGRIKQSSVCLFVCLFWGVEKV